MKICWLNGFRMKKSKDDKEKDALAGGAETTIDYLIKKGIELGHDIEIMTPWSIDMDKIKACDMVFLSNIPYDLKKETFNIADLDWVVENKKFIKIEHDANFCRYRNVQCDDQSRCVVTNCQPFWFRKLFKKALLTIFLSPLQKDIHERFFWNELKDKSVCIPPCIKKTFMVPSEKARIKGTYCVVGSIYPGKGIEDILDQYQQLGKNLRFIGGAGDQILLGSIARQGHTLVPQVPYNEMPSVLQKYEYMIISRRIKKKDNQGRLVVDEKQNQLYAYMNESFGRIIPEALNCGVKILVDKDSKRRIGAYSYGWTDQEIVNNCDKADVTFWDILKEKKIV